MFEVYNKLLSYVPEKKKLAYLGVFFSAISSLFLIGSYYYLFKFLDGLIVTQNIHNTKQYAVLIVVLLILQGIMYFVAVAITHALGFRLETNLRKRGIEGLMKSSFSFFDLNSSGKIRKIIDDNAQETHAIVAHLIPDNTAVVVTPILMIALGFFIDPKIGAFLILMTLVGFLQIKAMVGNQEFMGIYIESLETLNSETIEYVRGMQVVKIFKTTVSSFKSLFNAITSYSKYALDYAFSCRKPYIMFQVLFNTFITFTIPIGIFLINRGESSDIILRNVIFFACFGGLIFGVLLKVMSVGRFKYMGISTVEKLENLYDDMLKDTLKEGNITNFDSYDIEFDNVSFGYEEGKDIISNLSFKLKEKRVYAIVGSSGSGKSTIAKLLSGFYNAQSGQIKIANKNILEYKKEALMDNISFVFQNSKLFKKSIYDNVKIGNPNATREQVMTALSLACCDEIIDRLKDRENTIVGSSEVHLSGGEKQRIAIARAILKDANIVILDEASAATDPENEYEIQKAFSNLMSGKTVIMIAHRLSSIKNVDEILVVDDGKIIERGTDKELMENDGKYKQLQTLYELANDWRV
ncbi:MAG: ABC transporter ATP-binding protein [Peptostreptococcus sp.]|uniref:ABC transporter ATP-binding protein n=1 Tax=Peptostreptococcus sp. TaxID=1262 RepID=UPI002FCB2801